MLMNSLLKIKNRYDIYASLDLVSVNKKNLNGEDKLENYDFKKI